MIQSTFEQNRRRADRKPLERMIRYRVLNTKSEDAVGIGRTLNMSSSGVLFTSQKPLPMGRGVEMSINWPAQLDDGCRLKLVAWGTVVRNAPNQVAVQIEQYEFRTASRSES